MPTNRKILTALRKILYPEKDLHETYQRERKIANLTHPPLMKPFFKKWDQQVIADGYEIPVRLFFPLKESDAYPLLIFFHGGGFVTGNIDSYSNICAHMANITGHIVLSVDYRLAPEHPFPCGLEDCYAVVKEVVHSPLLAYNIKEGVILMGDSAGGNLAAAVSLLARDRGEFKIAKQILLYPAVYYDHSENSPFPSVRENGSDYLLTSKRMTDFMALYVKDKRDLKSPYVAPLLAEDLSHQPETLIITAAYDLLRDEAEAYGKKLHDAGNHVEIYRMQNAIHGFISLSPLFKEVKDSYRIINRFLTKEKRT